MVGSSANAKGVSRKDSSSSRAFTTRSGQNARAESNTELLNRFRSKQPWNNPDHCDA